MTFRVEPFLEVAEILVSKDETILALKVLDSLPGYYRDNPPQEVSDLKNLILSKITIPHDLLDDKRELPKDDSWSVRFMNGTMRGAQLKRVVKEFNDKNETPSIFEFGPGDGTFVIGLHVENFKFKYKCLSLNKESKEKIAEKIGDKYDNYSKTDIFVAFEVIEHLYNPIEIRQVMNRLIGLPTYVLLSTPKYCFSEGTPNWKEDGIHHLVTFTPREFVNKATELFPEYEFYFADDPVMVLIGKLRGV